MNYNNKIDYTVLNPDCTGKDIVDLCNIAKNKKYISVVVPPYYVKLARNVLNMGFHRNKVFLCTVIGFPLGFSNTKIKILEA
jgi:deoxyribose-phosphate aldolase